MPVKTIKMWSCDLCGTTKKEETNIKPRGWADISIENPYCERSFTDKCVCTSCIEQIMKRSKQ